ncbi:hypothetical protein GCG54_00014536 [Colletotrichum gloeosporioides]|uniref:F-box domain-containing protein n=1 Tax=Colletotrichum gloeosporioides TaxID=474922 RepID=A0A8H4CXI2_COLGL|nr:uncharacterized protein GCG54_00014536 [Colletotrichum gloeosporioides]KAF3811784.1 hypothetical protein GCG54_00014536 [Colletotrichum gloeosporioides]
MEIDSTNAFPGAFIALLSHVRHSRDRSPTFPVEIFEAILADESLTQPDLKALRQTCRLFAFLVTDRLFERIGISRTWRDRKSFLNIAATPHLAKAVRTVVWYELPGNESNLRLFNGPGRHPHFSDGPEPPKCRLKNWRKGRYERKKFTWPDLSRNENAWRNRMFTEAASLFWWKMDITFQPCRLYSHSRVAANEKIAADFFPVFCDSLRAMPGLSTFGSEPMHPDRLLQDAVDGYPFVAQLYQSHEESVVDTDFSGIRRFLQKAIVASRQWPGGPSIDELHVVPINYHISPSGMYGFDLIKRLHFCCLNRDPDGMINLREILGASRNLSSLRLCFDIVGQEIPPFPSERVPSPEGLSYVTLDGTNVCLFASLSRMPRLESLYLDGVPFSLNGLASFLEKHAHTLRADSVLDMEAQTFEDDMSLDSDGSYEPGDDDFDDLESIKEDDITAGQPVMPWEDDERPMYAREHMSHLRHLERFRASGDKGPAMWHFKKRNGEEAWGEDPLEFWSDWEGSEAGDVTEPASSDWKAAALVPRKKKPLTRSFFSKWDEPRINGRIAPINPGI